MARKSSSVRKRTPAVVERRTSDTTLTWSSPDACRANSKVEVTSSGFHRGAELPGNDVAGEVVEHGRQIEPTPASHLQISEAGLPKLVRRRRLVLELVGSLHHDEGRTGASQPFIGS
jgi:hypothetical protein